jgi:hypothetical protein
MLEIGLFVAAVEKRCTEWIDVEKILSVLDRAHEPRNLLRKHLVKIMPHTKIQC